MRALAGTRAATMRVALHEGNQEEFVRAFRDIIGMGRMWAYQPFLIMRFQLSTIHTRAFDELRYCILDDGRFVDISEATLIALLDVSRWISLHRRQVAQGFGAAKLRTTYLNPLEREAKA